MYYLTLMSHIWVKYMTIGVLPTNTFSGSIHRLGHIQLRSALEPGLKQVIHLILPSHTMEMLVFFLSFIVVFYVFEVSGEWQPENHIIINTLKKLQYAFFSKVSGMMDTSFIKSLCLHVQIIAPVTCLKKASIIEAWFNNSSHCTQKNETEKNGPTYCLKENRNNN